MLPRNKMRSESTKCYFTALCLFMLTVSAVFHNEKTVRIGIRHVQIQTFDNQNVFVFHLAIRQPS